MPSSEGFNFIIMNKIGKFLKDLVDGTPRDKKDHLVLGDYISLAIVLLALLGLMINPLFSIIFGGIGYCFALVVGIGKELDDKRTGNGNPEIWDAVATLTTPTLIYGGLLIGYFLY